MPFVWVNAPDIPAPIPVPSLPSDAVSVEVAVVANTVNATGNLLYNTAAIGYDVIYPVQGISTNIVLSTFTTLNVTSHNVTSATIGTLNVAIATANAVNINTLIANTANIDTLYSPTFFNGSVDSDPTANLGIASKQYVDAHFSGASSSGTDAPIGQISRFTSNQLPNGWIRLTATASRTTYANLFAALSTWYGEGDGTTTFGLPTTSEPFIGIFGANNITLPESRYGITSIMLPNNQVVIIGGDNGVTQTGNTYIGTRTTRSMTWRQSTTLPVARYFHISNLLADGRIFVSGGYNAGSQNQTYFGTISGITITWAAGTVLPGIRYSHTITQLSDGRLLMIGGSDGVARAQTYFGNISGTTITWSAGTALPLPRYAHTTNYLSDGRVLVIGGHDSVTARAQTYFGNISGTTITWSAGTSLPLPRFFHSANTLSDGRIIVIGGHDGGATRAQTYFGNISGTTITWNPGPDLPEYRYGFASLLTSPNELFFMGGHTGSVIKSDAYYGTIEGTDIRWHYFVRAYHGLCTLSDGRLLTAGGQTGLLSGCENVHIGYVNTANVNWIPSTNLPVKRYGPTLTPLSDGRVLVVAGFDPSLSLSTSNTYFGNITANSITWSAGTDLPNSRYVHTTTLLRDNRVLVIGGYNSVLGGSSNTYFGNISGTTITWSAGTSLPLPRYYHTTEILSDGRILVIGGSDGAAIRAQTYFGTIISNSTTISWATGTPLPIGLQNHASVALPDGRVVVMGGDGGGLNNKIYVGRIMGNNIAWIPSINLPRHIISMKAALVSDNSTIAIHGGYTTVLRGETYFLRLPYMGIKT